MSEQAATPLSPGMVSIVIPVHNGLPYIEESVESALNQDYPNIEVLVMENVSDDGTKEYLESINDPRVRIVEQPQLVPVDQNFTSAVGAASGEFVRILCADDFLKPGAVSAHVAAFSENPNAVLVSSTRDICDERGKTIIKGRGLDGLNVVSDRSDVVSACLEYGTNVIGEPFCRTSALQAELPFSSELKYVLDVELYVRALRWGTLATISGAYSGYRIVLTSYSSEVAARQGDDFAQWVVRLAADDSLDITDEAIEHARKQARKNQFARKLLYRYLGIRESLRSGSVRRRS